MSPAPRANASKGNALKISLNLTFFSFIIRAREFDPCSARQHGKLDPCLTRRRGESEFYPHAAT